MPFLVACEAALPTGYRYELLFIDDGSSDGTAAVVGKLRPSRRDVNTQLLELSRNFGKEIAVTAGLRMATGDAAVIIDADLQHPPKVIVAFIAAWQAGADVVIGVRTNTKDYAPLFKRLGSKIFYLVINKLSAVEIMARATDFRLLDRVVINEFNRLTEHDRISRGLIDWLGFSREYIEFMPAARTNGQASYSLGRLSVLFLNSVVGMSLAPLKFAGYLGLIITSFFGLLGALIALEMFGLNDPLNLNIGNSIDLAVLIIFLIGIVLMALGLVSFYIATIHTEVTNRPLYVVRPPRRPRPKPVI